MSDKARARIAVLGTGGTIAGAAAQGLGYRAGALSLQDVLAVAPGVDRWLQLDCQQVINVGSQNIDYGMWHKLAAAVQARLDLGDIDGMVITHGTDTLEETAYFLDLVISSQIPVVMTGAMRPAHVAGSDVAANLLSALAVAADPSARGRGVLVVMNEKIHSARAIQKMAVSGVDAFASPNSGPVGWTLDRATGFYGAALFSPPLFGSMPAVSPPKVHILYSYGDLDVELVRAVVGLRPAGIVLAGVGSGNTTDAALAELAKAAAQGVAIVRASRTGAGRVVRNMEVDDDNLGFIVSGDLNPQKARILLMLAVAQEMDAAQVQEYFLL